MKRGVWLALVMAALPARAAEPGKLEGRVVIGTKPAARTRVLVEGYGPGNNFRAEAETGAEGRFTLPNVPPGKYRVSRLVEFTQTTAQGSAAAEVGTHGEPVEVTAGRTAAVTVGGRGRTVVGQLTAGQGLEGRKLAFTAGNFRFLTRKEARAGGFPGRVYVLHIQEDGSFRCEDVPPGEYSLFLTVKEFHGSLDGPEIGRVSQDVSVPEEEGAGLPVSLGKVPVPRAP